MESFENQITTAKRKIRNANRWPYAEKIFKTVIFQSDTGDAIAITSTENILRTFCDETDIDGDNRLSVSVETSTMVRNKTSDSLSNLSQNNHIQLVDIKAYFMNEIIVIRNR